MKDLLFHNGVGVVAFAGVHLADAVSPIPSTFWQAFALLAVNTAGTFLLRWIREQQRTKKREAELAEQLSTLIADVKQLREDFDRSQQKTVRRKR